MDHARDYVDEVMRVPSTASKNDLDTRGKCRAGSRLISLTSRTGNTTMASISEEEQERIETVSKFLLQSPPGEINDVLNGTVHSLFHISWPDVPAPAYVDVRVLIGDDESLETGILPALTQYNLEQLTVAEVPGAGHSVGH